MHYKRNLTELKDIKKNWKKVFSCFSCGWWSTMWYKYAWYDIIGTCEIDPKMDKVYRANFWNTHNFLMWVQEMKNIPNDQLPKELFDLDILDWSPPCSTFSTAWSREKARGKNKVFREGQAKQVLSDLFFDFLDVAEKLKPKVIIAENVSWMLKWNAKWYVKMILERLDSMWYKTQLFLLNWATMWLPQKRERVFFISHKKELDYPKLKLEFNEKPIYLKEALYWLKVKDKRNITDYQKKYWDMCKQWENFWKYHPKWNSFCYQKVNSNDVCGTLQTKWDSFFHRKEPRQLQNNEWQIIWSYPQDYNFLDIQPKYLIWMSVPPLMMYKVSNEVYKQRFLSNI